jgi:alpha-galactosidase
MLKVFKENNDSIRIVTPYLSLVIFKAGDFKGAFQVTFYNDNEMICCLNNCYASINLKYPDHDDLHHLTSKNFEYDVSIIEIRDNLGVGLNITLSPKKTSESIITFNLNFKIYESHPYLITQIIDLESQTDIYIHSISPFTIDNQSIYLSGDEFPTDLRQITWFKNGWQSWSYCSLLYGNEVDVEGPESEIFNLVYENQDNLIKGRFYSEYFTVITDLRVKNSLILGFTTFKDQFSRIILDYQVPNKVDLLTAIGCLDEINIKKSNIKSSEQFFISAKNYNKGYQGLLEYAKYVKKTNAITISKEIPVGWCSWYYYFTNISQDKMIENLNFFKQHKDIQINFIQLDDGYFNHIGDFTDRNDRFPDPLSKLFNEIKKGDFKGGIWTAPFFAVRKSELFKNHRDWFLTRNNKLLKTNFNWNSFQYSLDLSNHEVIQYLNQFFEDLLYAFDEKSKNAQNPLIEFFKIDFLHAGVPYKADYQSKVLTRAQIYRNAIQTIKKAIKDDTFLLGCGAPLGPCIGLVDAMRISGDTAPQWTGTHLETFANGRGISTANLKEALINTLYRSFMHKHFWINDPDCLMIRKTETELREEEIKLQLTIFGLSGGQILISDEMTKLSLEELNDAKLVTPPYNPIAHDPIVIDAFIAPLPSVYILETQEIIGKRFLCALINWEDHQLTKEFKIKDLLPIIEDNFQEYLLYEFWSQKVIGKFPLDSLIRLDVMPHSCLYLNIIPINQDFEDQCLFISSNAHISQGCQEIKNFAYDEENKEISLKINLPGKRKGDVWIKFPSNLKTAEGGCSLCDQKMNIWKISLDFKDTMQITLKLR